MKTKTALPEDLATKYRPRTFADVVGQAAAVKAIARAIDNGRPLRQVLLTGDPGVGKTTLARIIAASLNCETGMSSQPCGQCKWCERLRNGWDLAEVNAVDLASARQLREAVRKRSYGFFTPPQRVCIIDEVHELTPKASSALLKPLESPPDGMVSLEYSDDFRDMVMNKGWHGVIHPH